MDFKALMEQFAQMRTELNQLKRASTTAQVEATRIQTGKLSSAGRVTNLVPNPSFELDTTEPWVLESNSTSGPGFAIYTGGINSAQSAKLSSTELNSSKLAVSYTTPVTHIGAAITVNCRIKPLTWTSGTQTIRVELEWLDINSVSLGVVELTSATAGLFTLNTWSGELLLTGIPTVGSESVVLRISVSGTGAATLLLDQILLYTGDTYVPYFDGASVGGKWAETAHSSISTFRSGTSRKVILDDSGLHQIDSTGRKLFSLGSTASGYSALLTVADPDNVDGTLASVAGGGLLGQNVGATGSLTHLGENMGKVLTNNPGEQVAYVSSTATSKRTNGEVGLGEVSFNAKAGRQYEITSNPLQAFTGSSVVNAESNEKIAAMYVHNGTTIGPGNGLHTIFFGSTLQSHPLISTGGSRFTFQESGPWTITATMGLDPSTDTTGHYRMAALFDNGGNRLSTSGFNTLASNASAHPMSVSRNFDAGDWVEVRMEVTADAGTAGVPTDTFQDLSRISITFDGTFDTQVNFRGTTTGSAPTVSSTTLGSSYIKAGSAAPARMIYTATTDHVARILATLKHQGPSQVYSHIKGSSTQPIDFNVKDLGPTVTNTFLTNHGSGSSPDGGLTSPPARPKLMKVKQYLCDWSRTFNAAGELVAGDLEPMTQGLYSIDQGEHITFIGFPHTTIQTDMNTVVSMLGVRLRLYAQHWFKEKGGTVCIGGHSLTVAPTGMPNRSTYKLQKPDNVFTTYKMGSPDLQWIDLPNPTQLKTDFDVGTYTGLVLCASGFSGLDYFGKFHGNNMPFEPILEFKYADS